MPGPPRTPTSRKILAGNPGKRKLNRNEPQPTPATADAPEGLPGPARVVWDSLAPELVVVGCLTVVDRGELAKACRYEALAQSLLSAAEGEVSAGKGKKLGPALWAALKAGEKASVIFSRFGITPSERTKLSVTPPNDDANDPIEQIREKRRLAGLHVV